MFYYAQINEENICVGVSDLSGEVSADNMIRIDTMDTSLLGKKYNSGNWETVEPIDPQPESKLTQLQSYYQETQSILPSEEV